MRLGPIHVECDAPPYLIVKACADVRVGLVRPEDVRWVSQAAHMEKTKLWYTCSCGQPVPKLERIRFFRSDNTQKDYLLGQCVKCWTIYWKGIK